MVLNRFSKVLETVLLRENKFGQINTSLINNKFYQPINGGNYLDFC